MQTLDLQVLNLNALSQEEMILIDGGNIFKDVWDWVKSVVQDVGEWMVKNEDELLSALGVLTFPVVLALLGLN